MVKSNGLGVWVMGRAMAKYVIAVATDKTRPLDYALLGGLS
jgi:hypothetical protein